LAVEAYHDSEAVSGATQIVLADCARSERGIAPASASTFPNPVIRSKKLSKASENELKALLMDAHARLRLVAAGANASRAVTLGRFGSFEVRLTQPMSASSTGEDVFWMELFDHDRQLSIDSVGNLVLEDAIMAAGDFIACARERNENPHDWRRST
jgi:hypothetical protein